MSCLSRAFVLTALVLALSASDRDPKHHGRPSFSPLPSLHQTPDYMPSQTPVVLQDEDILSDVVPSNIVSRQVS